MWALIIGPKDKPAPAREFAIVMGEFDLENQENFLPMYYLVNGNAAQYMGDKMQHAKQGELVRMYVISTGTAISYPFHLHSTIIKAYLSGLFSNAPMLQ